MKILVINPGATSTKIAVFQDDTQIYGKNISHSAADLSGFDRVIDQFDYRYQLILHELAEAGFKLSDFNAVCGRGGLLRHIPSGTYLVSDRVLQDVYNPLYGDHASNLGTLLANKFAHEAGVNAYFTDPVSTDEMDDIARVSGFCGMERQSFFHALNQKGMARLAATQLGVPYEALNLIVAHMGGGVSVAAHRLGRVVDAFNAQDDGSFSMDRGGALPVNAVIDLCFSGKTKAEIKRRLGRESGVFSYLGTRNFLEVATRAEAGDDLVKRVFDALVYQHCKDIGAMAAVLDFKVDAIVLTGGMANSKKLCADISAKVGALAKIIVMPGEEEMRSLALGTLRVLRGECAACEY